jgi:hypothetical protein
MNQKQHEQLNLDSFKNKQTFLDKKLSLKLEPVGLVSNICLNTNEIQNVILPSGALNSPLSLKKKCVHLSINDIINKNPLKNSNDSSLFDDEIKLEDTKAHYPTKIEAYLESLNESENRNERRSLLDIESNSNLIFPNNSYLTNCFTKLYSDKEVNEKNETSTENIKKMFEKACFFPNKNINIDKGSEFRHYKNNVIRRESKTSLSEIMSAHQAINAYQAKKDKESNLKYNAPKKAALKAKVYNFLERPSGWLCFIYHFTV